MKVLIDASLPRDVARVLLSHAHEPFDVRDHGLGTSPDTDVAALALRDGLVLLTGDFDFADIRAYPPKSYAGTVVIDRPDGARVDEVDAMVARVFADAALVSLLAGRLVIVDPRRVRVRPPLD